MHLHVCISRLSNQGRVERAKTTECRSMPSSTRASCGPALLSIWKRGRVVPMKGDHISRWNGDPLHQGSTADDDEQQNAIPVTNLRQDDQTSLLPNCLTIVACRFISLYSPYILYSSCTTLSLASSATSSNGAADLKRPATAVAPFIWTKCRTDAGLSRMA
jgi:hypothetical protein